MEPTEPTYEYVVGETLTFMGGMITVTRRHDDWMAHITGDTGRYEASKFMDAAIGGLVRNYGSAILETFLTTAAAVVANTTNACMFGHGPDETCAWCQPDEIPETVEAPITSYMQAVEAGHGAEYEAWLLSQRPVDEHAPGCNCQRCQGLVPDIEDVAEEIALDAEAAPDPRLAAYEELIRIQAEMIGSLSTICDNFAEVFGYQFAEIEAAWDRIKEGK